MTKSYNRLEARALARAIQGSLVVPAAPIHDVGSRVELPPFEVFRESDRMKPDALRRGESFVEAGKLVERGDPASLVDAFERLTHDALVRRAAARPLGCRAGRRAERQLLRAPPEPEPVRDPARDFMDSVHEAALAFGMFNR